MKNASKRITDMPGIGSLICEIEVKISEILRESKHTFALLSKTKARVLSQTPQTMSMV